MNQLPEERARIYYNNYSASYDEERRKGYYSSINDLEYEKIVTFAQDKETLEIGCGTGLILERTNKVAKNAVGVDISDGMLNVCRKKNLIVQKASATDLPFDRKTFDLVYSFKVLSHIPKIERALDEIVRVTKDDGRMILEFYNPISFKGLNDKIRIAIKNGNPVFLKHYTLKQIKKILPSGVKVVSIRGVRIWGCCACCYTLPVIGNIFRFLDWISCDSILQIFGGYFIVELAIEQNDQS